jgi:hypothetical protein
MKLSRSHDLGHEFGRLTRVDSIYFFIYLIDFFILSCNIGLIEN